jgi:CBS domain-containing protein
MNAKVRDLMTPGPIGVDYYQSVGDAARTMRDWGIGAVLVVREQALRGLVTDRDLVVRVVAESKGADEPVGPLSSGDLIGVNAGDDAAVAVRLMREHAELAVLGPDDDVDQARRLVRERAVRRIPIVQDGTPVGVVSIGDLALDRDQESALSDTSVVPPNSWPAFRQRSHRRGA